MFADYSIWDKLSNTEKPLFLYGTGNGGDKIISALERAGASLTGVFASDGFVRDRFFRGFKVMAYSDVIDKYGYDGKQVSHLIRVDDYLERYIKGESYESCLIPSPNLRPRIMEYKMLDRIPLEEAREEAKAVLAHTEQMEKEFCANKCDQESEEMRELLEDVSYNIMKIAVEEELKK